MSWLRGMEISVIDTETTGLDPESSHLVEVAVVHLTLGVGEPSVAYSTRIRPPVPIPAGATAVHGIADEDVADAPTFAEALPDLCAAIRGVCAAWNAPFDFGHLSAEIGRLDMEPSGPLAWPWLDSMVWSREVDRYSKGGHSLAAAAARHRIAYPAHGAAADAMVTALLLPRLLRRCWVLPAGHWSDIESLARWQEDLALRQEADLGRWLLTKGQVRSDWPWHALAGVTPPSLALPEPRVRVGADGTVEEVVA